MVGIAAASLVWSVLAAPLDIRIHDIQGHAHLSPFAGRAVSGVTGVVTAVGANTFYMQDPVADDDPATSEAVRVIGAFSLRAGDRVSVDGVVRETRFGCSSCGPRDVAYENLTTTELAAQAVSVLSHGEELPAPVPWVAARAGGASPDADSTAPPADVEISGALAPNLRRLDRDESLEGMRLTMAGISAAGPLLSSDSVHELAVQSAGEAEAVMVASALGVALPQASRGDRFAGSIEGVLDYRAGHYALFATAPVPRLLASVPTPSVAAAVPSDDELVVATFNLQNFAVASSPEKREGLAATIVFELGAPDLLIVEEVQDDSGARDDGTTSADATYAALVQAIAAEGGPPYHFRDLPPDDGSDGGQPGANIRVGALVRADRRLRLVERVDDAQERVARLRAGAPPHLLASPARLAPEAPAFTDSRKPLVMEMSRGDEVLFVVGCHFVSQLTDPPRYGRFQPPARRSRGKRDGEAAAVAELVATLLARDPTASVLVVGDLNDEPSSPALRVLRDSGVVDVLGAVDDAERVTHVYQGIGESLDHILASAALGARLIDARVVHVMAGRAGAPSDHDPVVARFRIAPGVGVARGVGSACGVGRAASCPGVASSLLVVTFVALFRRARRVVELAHLG